MAETLLQYADGLADRRDLIWPQVPDLVPVNAKPATEPLRGIKAVTWSVYGVLLRISDGKLLFEHETPLRMQVALDKTIHEFNMWNHMTRKPGAPWETLLPMYRRLLDEQQMVGGMPKGDFPEVDAPGIWRRILRRLKEKEYTYEVSRYGDEALYSEKIAYFFHSCLQGTEAAPNALAALQRIGELPVRQSLLSDGQAFTVTQLLRGLNAQGTLPRLEHLFSVDCNTWSFEERVRKPSGSLYRRCLERWGAYGIEPEEVLHVGSRVRDDLAIAKRAGMRTVLYAGDKCGLQATRADLRNRAMKPDRLITDLRQLRDILSSG